MAGEYELLSTIVNPTDLHKFSVKELSQVADELRQAILDNVSKTGGHFSSNLGTVELTVALYAAYSIPPDKVIWDTGHQAYPHKLLTGRLPRFDTLRQHKGISGFLKRDEHELDAFGAGHAGTAISAGLGFAKARDQVGGSERVVSITGDAAICSGMSWEALNHGGELQTDMMVVLNDNRMSIAPNVGAMTRYFTSLRSRREIQDAAQMAKRFLENMPGPAHRIAAGIRHGVTHYFAPEETGTIFEEMGWEYIGPVDGHDLPSLYDIFCHLRELKLPLFVHALTVKGKGYDVAEEDATKWHGVSPFDVEEQEMPKSAGPVAYTKVFGEVLVEMAEEDPMVSAITAGMPDGTGLNKFAETYPDRYWDVGIAEEHAVTFAAGLAGGGVKPFCTIYSTFLQRGFDQIIHDVCLQKLPVRFCMDRGGLVGADGPTHHGTFDLSYLGMMPHIGICAPRDGTELREMMRFMGDYQDGPTAIRYPRGGAPDQLPENRTAIEFGKSEVLGCRGEGKPAATIAAIGSMVKEAWDAAGTLAEEGINVCVVNARWAKPIDIEAIQPLAEESGQLITVEENVQRGGYGEALISELRDAGAAGFETKVIALPDRFIEHGTQAQLLNDLEMDAEGLAGQIRSAVKSRS
jgi:1-deoxy-D-xylulose-5-phosphate synthase